MTKVLFTGGRENFVSDATLDDLARIHNITEVVHGDAKGIDSCVEAWAKRRGIVRHIYPAQWDRDGNYAGPIRNGLMLREQKPDMVIAFPGGDGTRDMVAQATKAWYCEEVIHAK